MVRCGAVHAIKSNQLKVAKSQQTLDRIRRRRSKKRRRNEQPWKFLTMRFDSFSFHFINDFVSYTRTFFRFFLFFLLWLFKFFNPIEFVSSHPFRWRLLQYFHIILKWLWYLVGVFFIHVCLFVYSLVIFIKMNDMALECTSFRHSVDSLQFQ